MEELLVFGGYSGSSTIGNQIPVRASCCSCLVQNHGRLSSNFPKKSPLGFSKGSLHSSVARTRASSSSHYRLTFVSFLTIISSTSSWSLLQLGSSWSFSSVSTIYVFILRFVPEKFHLFWLGRLAGRLELRVHLYSWAIVIDKALLVSNRWITDGKGHRALVFLSLGVDPSNSNWKLLFPTKYWLRGDYFFSR